MTPRHLGLVLLLPLGCAPGSAPPAEPTAEATAALSVQEAADGACSTAGVEPLSEQLVAQGNCNVPGAFATVPGRPNATFSDTVFPYLQKPARDAFLAALDSAPNTSMQVHSMLRTVAQQYLLFSWFEKGTCGVSLASSPGKSPHESGVGIDIEEHALWQPALEAQGFEWQGASDPVHFTYVGAGAADNKGIGVLAFQQLWNFNHPDDLIDEDGLYGPQTEARLVQSPAEGFAVGASCDPGSGGGGAGGGSAGGGSAGSGAGGQGGTDDGGAGGATAGSGAGGSGTVEDPSGCSFATAPGASAPFSATGAAFVMVIAAAAARARRTRFSRKRKRDDS